MGKKDYNVDEILDGILFREEKSPEENQSPQAEFPEEVQIPEIEFDEEEAEESTEQSREKSSNFLNIRNVILIASSVVLAVSIGIIAVTALKNFKNEPYVPIEVDFAVMGLSGPPDFQAEEESTAEILPQWAEWYERNNEFVGWVKIGETKVDYPVVQHNDTGDENDNHYYLKYNIDKKYSVDGTVYVDTYTHQIADKRRPDNTILYGHNQLDGRMFTSIMRYYTTLHRNGYDLTHYNQNPTIEFTTMYDDNRNTYKIFAGMFVNTDEAHGDVFDYWRRGYFRTKAEFYDYVANTLDRSAFYTDVDLEYGDELLTLSTCYYPLGHEDDRFVVVARRVREGEDPTVDTTLAYINPSPMYFTYYYRWNGGSWAGRNWDTSKVKGFDEFYSNQ